MARVKEYTLVGFAADANGLVATGTLGAADTDPDALALDQELDIAASTTAIALAQNPNNALDADAFAVLQTYTINVPLTLTGGAASISPSRRASFTSTANLSGTNFTIVGTGVDLNGDPITGEVVAGPNNNTVNSLHAYSAITSITPDQTQGVNQVSAGYPAYLDAELTLEGLAASLIPPRNVSLTSGVAADFSNVDFTIIGTDENGDAAQETIAGPNNSTVAGAIFFSAVTSIALQRTAASVNANVSAGHLANSVGQPITLNGTLGNGITLPSDVFAATHVTLTSSDNLNTLTFTIVGLDQYGSPRTEAVTGPNATTVASTGLFTRVDSIAVSDDNAGSVSVGVHPVSEDGLTLIGGGVLDPPRELVFDSTGDISAIVFTITGKDRWGNSITEQVTGVTTTENPSTKRVFALVESIVPSAASSETVDVGWLARTVSPWVVCGRRFGFDVLQTCMVSLLATVGAADGIVEVTYDTNQSPAHASYPHIFDAPQKGEDLPVDETIAVTPGTPVEAQGLMCRAVLTSGVNTEAKARFAQPGPS